MHVPLDPHLHTEECNVIIAALKECQTSNGKFKQIFGVCNDLDLAMRKCTRKERLERTRLNLEASRERQKAVRTRIADMEAQGKTWRDVMKEKKEAEMKNTSAASGSRQ